MNFNTRPAQDALLDSTSVAWDTAARWWAVLGGQRALLLQVAHPQVAAAVSEHSNWEARSLQRLVATLRAMLRLSFGSASAASDQAEALGRVHGSIVGRTDDGVGYDADDPDDEVLGELTGDTEEQRDQATGTGHLGQQVEERDAQDRDGGGQTDRALLEAVGEDVGHGEAAGVAQEFGDQQQGHEPGDEEADRVEEAVHALEGDGAGDAEEGRRRQVVTGDGDAVLRSGERAATGEELRCGLVVTADADHHEERDRHEGNEDRDVDDWVADARSGDEVGGHCTSPEWS